MLQLCLHSNISQRYCSTIYINALHTALQRTEQLNCFGILRLHTSHHNIIRTYVRISHICILRTIQQHVGIPTTTLTSLGIQLYSATYILIALLLLNFSRISFSHCASHHNIIRTLRENLSYEELMPTLGLILSYFTTNINIS